MKESLLKELWPWPSKRVTHFLFQLSISTVLLTVRKKINQGSSRGTDPTLKRHILNYMLFHLRKMSDKAISKKKKEKKIWKHKYWTWRAYIVKVGKKMSLRKSYMPEVRSKFFFFGFQTPQNFFENSNETKVTCESLV